ncbi:MAG TPA: tetratricopeptide repeat protein, partial [Roseiflexaceae bacterium]
AAAEIAWAAGDGAAALRADARALAVQETPDGWVRLGDHARAQGDTRRALKAYREAMAVPSYVPAAAWLGDLLRATGDEQGARSAFEAPKIDQQWLTDWSWRELRPAPVESLAVGGGLDFGYVGGMYPAEQLQGALARWTDGRGLLRLRAAGASATRALLRLRLAAPHPDGGQVAVRVCAGGRCVSLDAGPFWRTYIVPIVITSRDMLVEVRSDTFAVPGDRRLGVLIDKAELLTIEDR